METILITGATSFIGQYLVRLLLVHYNIIAIIRRNSNNSYKLPGNDNLTIVELDMDEYDKIAENIHQSIDIFIHLAWAGTRGKERNNQVLQNLNLLYSLNALKCAKKLNAKIFISAGSQAEYGPWFKEEKLSEKEVARPNTEYGKFKLKFYELASIFCRHNGMKFIEPRFFSLYGPGDFEGTMIMSTLKKMLTNRPCDLTEGKQSWDFLYVDDAVMGIKKLIETNCSPGIYNFGYGESCQLKEYIYKMYQLTGSKSLLNFGSIPYPITGIVNINPCVEKLKNIGWRPNVNFETGIRKIIRTMSPAKV